MADESQNLSEGQEQLAEQGVVDMAIGADDLEYAHELADTATAEAMMAASDLTRAVDAEIVADRLSRLSAVVAAAGVNDIGQGAELIAAAENVEAISAAVGLMSVDDLETGLELGRLAGELRIFGRIVGQLEMPVLSAVLGDRSERLSEIATDTVLRAAATRSLTESDRCHRATHWRSGCRGDRRGCAAYGSVGYCRCAVGGTRRGGTCARCARA